MHKKVNDVMNQNLFATRLGETADHALDYLMMLGIHAAPVVDDAYKPVGMISISDLVCDLQGFEVQSKMTSPAVVVDQFMPLSEAIECFADSGYHHLPVVDAGGKAVGFLSIIDVVRAQLGHDLDHPRTSPHSRAEPTIEWSEKAWLTKNGIDAAPDEGGMLVLVARAPDGPEMVVWAEAADNLRERLTALRDDPPPRLFWYLEGGALNYRTAVTSAGAPVGQAFGAMVPRLATG
jgi:hypothetical protein